MSAGHKGLKTFFFDTDSFHADGPFDNSILVFHLDQHNEYMIENVEYCQGDACILHLHVENNQGAKLKEIDFVS